MEEGLTKEELYEDYWKIGRLELIYNGFLENFILKHYTITLIIAGIIGAIYGAIFCKGWLYVPVFPIVLVGGCCLGIVILKYIHSEWKANNADYFVKEVEEANFYTKEEVSTRFAENMKEEVYPLKDCLDVYIMLKGLQQEEIAKTKKAL